MINDFDFLETKCVREKVNPNPTRFYIVSQLSNEQVFRQGIQIRSPQPQASQSMHGHLFTLLGSCFAQATAVLEVAQNTARAVALARSSPVYLYEVNAGRGEFFNLARNLDVYLLRERRILVEPEYRSYLLSLHQFVTISRSYDFWITDSDIAPPDVLSVEIFTHNTPSIGYSNSNARYLGLSAPDRHYRILPPPPEVRNLDICYTRVGSSLIPTRFFPPWNVRLSRTLCEQGRIDMLSGRALSATLLSD